MWRSVFLHEFIDHRIDNFQAVAGAATPPSFRLTPRLDAVRGTNIVQITPGAGFEYALATPLQQVIGISCRVRLSYPISPNAHLFPVMQLGSFAEVLLWPQTHPTPDLLGTMANARVRVGAPYVNMGLVELPDQTFTDLRFDWHTSGQARLSADGRLVAYNNAVQPGGSFALDRVVFGLPNAQPPATHPLYLIARVFVRVLLRSDSLAQFSTLLPPVKPPQDDVYRCRLRVMGNLMQMVDRLRQFMASINQTLSQTWSSQSGPAGGPFKPEAIKAHDLAMQSMVELGRMMRTGDFATPDRFLEPFTECLRILQAASPAQFTALATELDGMEIVPDECRAVLEASLEENKDALGPLITLLTTASERVKQIAGGN